MMNGMREIAQTRASETKRLSKGNIRHIRITEAASYGGGGERGVTNTLAAALWHAGREVCHVPGNGHVGHRAQITHKLPN